MTDLTPDEIQQARDTARRVIGGWNERRWSDAVSYELARAVWALTEQFEPPQRESSLAQRIAAQCTCEYPSSSPEPVSEDELTHQLRLRHASGFSQVAKELLARFDIYRKQSEGADHG